MDVETPGSPAYTAILSLSGVARSVLRSPAVVITLESSGMVQTITTAATMPSAMNRSKNHVRRSRHAASVTTGHIRECLPQRFCREKTPDICCSFLLMGLLLVLQNLLCVSSQQGFSWQLRSF